MGKPEIRPPTTRTWLNWSSPNIAWLYSGSPTAVHNFITNRSGVCDPHIGEIVFTRLLSFCLLWVFLTGYVETVAPILTLNTSNGVLPRKDVPSIEKKSYSSATWRT